MEVMHKEMIGEVHSQVKTWLSELALFSDELIFFEDKLNEISPNYPDSQIQELILKFKNRFIIHKNGINQFNELIKSIEDAAVYSGKLHIRRISYNATEQFLNIANDFGEFEKSFKVMKEEFYKFLCKHL